MESKTSLDLCRIGDSRMSSLQGSDPASSLFYNANANGANIYYSSVGDSNDAYLKSSLPSPQDGKISKMWHSFKNCFHINSNSASNNPSRLRSKSTSPIRQIERHKVDLYPNVVAGSIVYSSSISLPNNEIDEGRRSVVMQNCNAYGSSKKSSHNQTQPRPIESSLPSLKIGELAMDAFATAKFVKHFSYDNEQVISTFCKPPSMNGVSLSIPKTAASSYNSFIDDSYEINECLNLIKKTSSEELQSIGIPKNGEINRFTKQMPKNDIHIHLSGNFPAAELNEIIQEKNLWFDPATFTFSLHHSEKYCVSSKDFKEKGCQDQLEKRVTLSKGDNGSYKFHEECFATIDSIIDCLTFKERINRLCNRARADKCIHEEVMHEGSIPFLKNELSSEEHSTLQENVNILREEFANKKNKRKIFNSEKVKRTVQCIYNIMWPLLKQSEKMQQCIEEYNKADFQCGIDLKNSTVEQNAERLSSGKLDVSISIIREINRTEDSVENFIWNMLCAHYLYEKCDIVGGLTLVGDEADHVATRDRELQYGVMAALQEIDPNYPPVSLHLGEFKKDGNHIAANHSIQIALDSGLAFRRISHGLTLSSGEDDYKPCLQKIMDLGMLCELLLTSNFWLNGIKKEEHPIKLCLAKPGLDWCLATDDAGIFKTNMGEETRIGIIDHNLSYFNILNGNRCALHHSFLRGGKEASIYFKNKEGLLEIKKEFREIYDSSWDLGDSKNRCPKIEAMIRYERAVCAWQKDLLIGRGEGWRKEFQRTFENNSPSNHQYSLGLISRRGSNESGSGISSSESNSTSSDQESFRALKV
jgi:adenosine deaminase